MMTALSVARSCNLVGQGERVILVSVTPPGIDSETGKIDWTELEALGTLSENGSVENFSTFKVRSRVTFL